MWNNDRDQIKIGVNSIIKNEVLMEIRTSKLYYGRQSTCRILSAIFIEKGTTYIDADFCQNNAVWI